MRRFLSERLDDAMLPFLKFISPGYQDRLSPFRLPPPCDPAWLAQISPPSDLKLQSGPFLSCNHVRGFQFSSGYEPSHPCDRTVQGRFITVVDAAPWVVVVPGYGFGALPPYGYSIYQNIQGRALLSQGLNVALIEPPFHLSRRRSGCRSGEGFFSPDLGQTQHAVCQGAADVVSLVRWLEERSGRPVGLWGTSMGGCISGLVTSLLPQLGAVVLMEPLDNPGDPMAALPGTGDIRLQVLKAGGLPADIPAQLRSVSPSAYLPAIHTDRLLFVSPVWDRVVPFAFQDAFWAAWGRPPRIMEKAGHITLAIHRPTARKAAGFLAKWLLEPAL